MRRIAYFISPHGFGHAARAASVMEAIHEIDPSIRFEIFTASPSWFFQDNLSGLFNYHYLLTDLGLVQKTQTDIYFVIPFTYQTAQYRDNLILLPHHSDFFHPDLVNAADSVIGKAGYSTIAEVFHAGVPFGYIPCPNNREASTLVAFIESEMPGLPISESTFQSGDWMELLKRLLNMPRLERDVPNGADQIAEFILNNLAST